MMAQEDSKMELKISCKWNGNFHSNQPTVWNGKSGVPPKVVRFSGKFPFDARASFTYHFNRRVKPKILS